MSMLNEQVAAMLDNANDEFNYEPNEYKDQTGPRLVEAGVYLVKPLNYALVTTREGVLVQDEDRDSGKAYPIIKLDGIQILEPEEAVRKVMLFQRIKTKPYNRRDGSQGNWAVEWLRSFDQTRRPRRAGTTGILEAIDDCVSEGLPFRCKLDWIAKSMDGPKQELAMAEAEGIELTREARNKVYNRFELKGMFRFPKNANGTRDQVWTAPNGEVVEARIEIVRFIPSKETVKLGPSGN